MKGDHEHTIITSIRRGKVSWTRMMLLNESYVVLILLLILFTGMIIGSFMNVVIYRLPLMIYGEVAQGFSLSVPGSHCPGCQSRIRWYDNIPLLSWLLLRGRCRYCQVAISVRYPLTELITGLYFVAVFLWHNEPSFTGFLSPAFFYPVLADLLLFCFAWCICWIDIRHYLIPDELSYGLLWSGLLLSAFHINSVALDQAVISCVAVWLMITVLQKGYFLLRRREGLGSGDVKLFAAVSVWLGWQKIPALMLLAALLGLAGFVGLFVYRRVRRHTIPADAAYKAAMATAHSGDIVPGRYLPFGPAIVLASLILFYLPWEW